MRKCQQQFQRHCVSVNAGNSVTVKDSVTVSQTAIDLLGWAGSHAAVSPPVLGGMA